MEAGRADGGIEGKPEAPERGRSGRSDEGSGLCPRVYGAGLDLRGGSVDHRLDCPDRRHILLAELTG